MKTTKFVFWLTPLLVLSLVCSFVPTAMAQNYFPLMVGNTWVLLSTDGAERRTYTLEGPETVDGEELILLKIAKETVGTDAVAFDKSWVTVAEMERLYYIKLPSTEGHLASPRRLMIHRLLITPPHYH